MKTHIVKIGNSQGVRIPKALLEQSGPKGKVTLEEEHEGLTTRRWKAFPHSL